MLRRRILFIDDEPLLREVMYEMLTEMGYEVRVEESGDRAIRTFTEYPEDYDLVLTDLVMFNMMGDEVAERIRSIRHDVPVVVMTGTPENLPPDKAEAAGICKVLPKPLTRAELREGLRGIVELATGDSARGPIVSNTFLMVSRPNLKRARAGHNRPGGYAGF